MKSVTIALLAMALTSCFGAPVHLRDSDSYTPAWNEITGKSLKFVVVDAQKSRRSDKVKFKMAYSIRNQYDHAVLIPENALHASIDDIDGAIAEGSASNPRWLLKPNDVVSGHVDFIFPTKARGWPEIEISHVQSEDGVKEYPGLKKDL